MTIPAGSGPGANITGATFYSYLTYSAAWDRLTAAEQDAFKERLPVPAQRRAGARRSTAILTTDRTYSSGGRALNRASVRSC